MLELLSGMMKEEWRIHSTMFGSLSFALFPVMICGIAFMGAFLIPLIQQTLPPGTLTVMVHANYLMLGIMVGGFGLLGNEVMNHRFGQASLLAYSARTLPLTERYIFLNSVIKDTVYYFFLWVLPFGLGYLLATPFTGVPVSGALLILLTLTLSFLFGLCGIFLLSTIYTCSRKAFWILLMVLAGAGIMVLMTGINPVMLFPPILLITAFTWVHFLLSCSILVILFGVSVILFNPESVGSEKKYQNMFTPLMQRLSFLPYRPLVVKDILDLYRSGSLIGQTIFSFLLPLIVIWFLLSLLDSIFPPHGLLFLMAVTTGVIASMMYTWLTMFDSYGPYASLPVPVSMLISGKLVSFAVLQIIPALFIAVGSGVSGEPEYLIPAVVLTLSISFYAVSVLILLCGLSPNLLVYDVRVFAQYLVYIGVVLVCITAVSFTDPYYALSSVLLAIPARFLIQKAKIHWNLSEPAGF